METPTGVTHITSGDIFGGAENVLIHLLKGLISENDVQISVILFNYGKLYDTLVSLNIDVTVFDETRIKSYQILRSISKYLVDSNTQILHTHGFKANILGNLSRLFISNRKIISIRTEHGFREYFQGIRKLKPIIYSLINLIFAIFFTRKVICVSNHIAQSKFPNFLKDRISVIYNGIDISKIEPRNDTSDLEAELNPLHKTFKIGAIGRLVPVKDFDNFIDAAKRVLESRNDCAFYIVGEGPLRSQFYKKISDYELTGNIIMTGFRHDIIDLINFLDVIIISSKMEGIPLTLLEALYLGKPVVATAVGGIPEVITDQHLGCLIPPQNPKELSVAILNVLENIKIIKANQRQIRQHILNEFTSAIMVKRVIKEYRQLLIG